MPVRAGLPDMIELIRLNTVVIFTCANDYADVKVRIPATFSRQASRTSGRDASHAGSKSSALFLRSCQCDFMCIYVSCNNQFPFQNVLRARVIQSPDKNLFSAGQKNPPPLGPTSPPRVVCAVTTVHAPGARDTTWSCPNSFVYMIKVLFCHAAQVLSIEWRVIPCLQGFAEGEQQPPPWDEGGAMPVMRL